MARYTACIGVSTPSAAPSANLVLGIVGSADGFDYTVDLDAFSADPVTDAGRMMPSGVVPADGHFVFCLGHDTPGYFAFVTAGDYAEIRQLGQLPPGNVIALQARTRAPAPLPPVGYAWIASVLLDGVEVGRRTLSDMGAPIDWGWYVDVARISGPHALAFRLTLTGPPGLVELEIPAFYLDALQFQSIVSILGMNGPVAPPIITNEEPADNGVISTVFECDVLGLGTDVDTTSIAVVVDSINAVIAGVAQSPFAATIGVQGEVVHVRVILPSVPLRAIVITVQAQVLGGPLVGRDFSYAPSGTLPQTIYTVVALDPERLRVTWTGTVQMSDPTAPHDSLNPALYAIQAIQPTTETPCVRGTLDPGLLPRVLRVEPVQTGNFTSISDSFNVQTTVVDLILDVEITPGVAYLVTETGVATPIGQFPSPYGGNLTSWGGYATSSAVAAAFVLPWPQGRVFDLMRWLPRMNRIEDVTHDLLRFVRCLQEPANLLLFDIDNWPDVLDVDRAPEPMIDAMLADLGNPFPFALSPNQKRQLVRLLVPIYQQKGTIPGIVNAIRFFLGITVTIASFTGHTMQLGVSLLGGESVPPGSNPARVGTWILGPGTSYALYCFRVVSPSALSATQIDQIKIITSYMKPAHTHLVEIAVPHPAVTYNPVELGLSELGYDWRLH